MYGVFAVFPEGRLTAKVPAAQGCLAPTMTGASVVCVPLVIPLLKARLHVQQAESDERRRNRDADQ